MKKDLTGSSAEGILAKQASKQASNQPTNMEYAFSHKTDEWETPQWLFDRLNRIFCFEIDVCANEQNHKCDRYFTAKDDALTKDWSGMRCWCNPPYGRKIKDFVKKASETVKDHNTTVVMLLPGRTDAGWYHEYIANNPQAHTVFLRGRLRFGGSKWNAPFPSMIVVFA